MTNYINDIMGSQNDVITNSAHILKIFVDFYKRLYNTSSPGLMQIGDCLVSKNILPKLLPVCKDLMENSYYDRINS